MLLSFIGPCLAGTNLLLIQELAPGIGHPPRMMHRVHRHDALDALLRLLVEIGIRRARIRKLGITPCAAGRQLVR